MIDFTLQLAYDRGAKIIILFYGQKIGRVYKKVL